MLAVVMPAAADTPVTSVTGLIDAIEAANDDTSGAMHTILVNLGSTAVHEVLTITGNVTLKPLHDHSYIHFGEDDYGNNGRLVVDGGTLIFDDNAEDGENFNLDLVGQSDNSAPLLHITNDGEVIFYDIRLHTAYNIDAKIRGVFIDSGGHLQMDGGSIAYFTADKGAGVYVGSDGKLTMNSGEISGNTATGNGGGVYVADGENFQMNGGRIIDGNTAENGGGVYIESGQFKMTNGDISSNIATENGGGVYLNNDAEIEMLNGNINSNNAKRGGGVYFSDNTLGGIFNGNINSNTATVDGGGLYLKNGAVVSMTGGSLNGNSAEYGGGVYVLDSIFEMTKEDENTPTLSNNHAKQGGGVYVNGGKGVEDGFKLFTGTLSGNTATPKNNEAGIGGAVYISKGSFLMGKVGESATETGGTITNNNADKGSAVYAAPDTLFEMKAGEIKSNNARLSGFAVCIDKATLNLLNGKITDNKAELYGGVYVDGEFNLGDLSEGWATVTGNSGGNVFLMEGTTITIPGRLHVNTNIGVTHQNQNPDERTLIAQGIERGSYKPDGMDAGHFFSDQKDYSVQISDGKIYLVYDPEEPKGSSTWIQAPGGSYGLYTGTVNNGGTVNLPGSSPVQQITLPAGFSGDVIVSTQKDPNLPTPTQGTVYKQFDVSTTATIPYGATASIGITFSASDLPQGQGVLVTHYMGADRGWVIEPSTATINGEKVLVTATVSGFSPFAIVFDETGVIPTEAINSDIAPPLENPGVVATPAESPAPVVSVIAGVLAGLAVLRRK